jgi:hypothetical protein
VVVKYNHDIISASAKYKCVLEASVQVYNKKKVKVSRYTPWRRMGGEEV